MFEEVRRRLQGEMQQRNIGAYLACTPANIYYTTGFFAPLVNLSWRLMGTDFAIIPADPALPPALVTSDFVAGPARAASGLDDVRPYRMWVENREVELLSGENPESAAIYRPPQFHQSEIHRQISAALQERGLAQSAIGVDGRYLYRDTLQWLERSNPGCRFADLTGLLYQLRSVKYPQEIERLRQAARLCEAGILRATAEARAGQTATEVNYGYYGGALDGAVTAGPGRGEFQGAFGFISAGTGARAAFGGTGGLASGDLIKFDCGTTVGGYYSDCGRTFAFGRATDEQRRVHRALEDAHAAARELLRPGVVIADIFHAAQAEMAAHGFPHYSRGHYGHSIGLDNFVEEPPFISPNEQRPLEPGMVLCLETPYYSGNLGSFQIEDMALITETGSENFNTLPYELVEL